MSPQPSSPERSFVDWCGLAPPIDLMRPAGERAAESGCVAQLVSGTYIPRAGRVGVRGTVRAWRTCWAVTRSGSGAVLAALCGRISCRTLGAILSGRGSQTGTPQVRGSLAWRVSRKTSPLTILARVGQLGHFPGCPGIGSGTPRRPSAEGCGGAALRVPEVGATTGCRKPRTGRTSGTVLGGAGLRAGLDRQAGPRPPSRRTDRRWDPGQADLSGQEFRRHH